MAKGYKDFVGGSFHDVYLTATVNEIISVLGEPYAENNTGTDKCNFDWAGITNNGIKFTVYDWKEYQPLELDEIVEWHIGGSSFLETHEAMEEILKDIHRIKKETELLKSRLGKEEFDALSKIGEINED